MCTCHIRQLLKYTHVYSIFNSGFQIVKKKNHQGILNIELITFPIALIWMEFIIAQMKVDPSKLNNLANNTIKLKQIISHPYLGISAYKQRSMYWCVIKDDLQYYHIHKIFSYHLAFVFGILEPTNSTTWLGEKEINQETTIMWHPSFDLFLYQTPSLNRNYEQ